VCGQTKRVECEIVCSQESPCLYGIRIYNFRKSLLWVPDYSLCMQLTSFYTISSRTTLISKSDIFDSVLEQVLGIQLCWPVFVNHFWYTQRLFHFYSTPTPITHNFNIKMIGVEDYTCWSPLFCTVSFLRHLNFCGSKPSVSVHADTQVTILLISSGTFYFVTCCVATDQLSCRLTFEKKETRLLMLWDVCFSSHRFRRVKSDVGSSPPVADNEECHQRISYDVQVD
jgi:hypothetical protein